MGAFVDVIQKENGVAIGYFKRKIVKEKGGEMNLRENIAKIIAGSRCEVCNNCGSSISTDNPDEVADSILAAVGKYIKEEGLLVISPSELQYRTGKVGFRVSLAEHREAQRDADLEAILKELE